MTKDGSNARKKAARELAAAEQIAYTEALRRVDQRAARTSPASEDPSAAAGAGRVSTRVSPPVAALTTDVVLIGHTGAVSCVTFGPDGRTLASSEWQPPDLIHGSTQEGGTATVRTWDLATGQATTLLSRQRCYAGKALAFHPGGRILACSPGMDGTLQLLDLATGQVTTLTGHAYGIEAAAFSPDGRSLATGSCNYTLRLWDVATGQTTTTINPRGGYVVSAAFSPDGRILASTSTDRTVRLWDPATGQPIATLFGHTEFVRSAAFSPGGHTLATASMDGTLRLWTLRAPS